MKYIRQAVPVEAVQWTGDNMEDIAKLTVAIDPIIFKINDTLAVCADGRTLKIPLGDYIVREGHRAFCCFPPEIFNSIYTKEL